MKTLFLLLALQAGAPPRESPSANGPLLLVEARVRYQLVGDTTWIDGRVVRVDNCRVVSAERNVDKVENRGGFETYFFTTVAAVQVRRVQGRDTTWVSVSENELGQARACRVGS
jgi:hypothetical protein